MPNKKITKGEMNKDAYASNPHIRRARNWMHRQGIRSEINRCGPDSGFWPQNNVEIALTDECRGRVSVQEALSNIFHEYGHVCQYRRGIWKKYIHTDVDKNSSTSRIRIYCRTALRAERHADWLGKKFMKKLFPGIRYIRGYTQANIAWWKRDLIIAEPRAILRHRTLRRRKRIS